MKQVVPGPPPLRTCALNSSPLSADAILLFRFALFSPASAITSRWDQSAAPPYLDCSVIKKPSLETDVQIANDSILLAAAGIGQAHSRFRLCLERRESSLEFLAYLTAQDQTQLALVR